MILRILTEKKDELLCGYRCRHIILLLTAYMSGNSRKDYKRIRYIRLMKGFVHFLQVLKGINAKDFAVSFRTIYGLTQAELAERAGVTLRSIQMYEQRNKNINKASW